MDNETKYNPNPQQENLFTVSEQFNVIHYLYLAWLQNISKPINFL